ncbi:MAG: hypothetical protein HRF46_13225 [Acidobacteriota bacterium]|jgi:ribosomal protein L12E/L44/L45/RPP1/RPP2
MSDATELGDLLFQLRAVDTPLKKLKVLAHAWRTVRRLTPRERRDIAAHIGLEEAERLIEQMGMKNGPITPALLLEAIHGAEQADPVKLRALLASLRDREARRELLQQGLAAASAALAPEPAAAMPSPPWLPPALGEEPIDEALREKADESREPRASPSPPPPPPRDEPPFTHSNELVTPTNPVNATARPPEANPPWGEPLASLPVAEKSQSLRHALPPTGQRLPGMLLNRLVALHRDRHRLASLPFAERLALAECFPDGWQRRRAVQALLAASTSPDPEETVALLATLAAERDRIWCVSQLLATGNVREPQLDQLLALIDSPRARRRLALRQAAVET